MTRRILVTAALPYANGSIHIGHLVEYLQTDIWARFQKLRGHDCIYCCADDTHGTPIMIRARQEGIEPEQLIEAMHEEHQRDFAGFDVGFDNYYTTHSPENREFAEKIYLSNKEAGHIATRDVEQAYCEKDAMFLPDRFVKGTCPKCQAEDQYGDQCEVCSATYAPTDLKDARCSLCGTPPIRKSSEHLFFKLNDFADSLKEFIDGDHVHEQVRNKLQEWFEQGLRDWDISRDAPYFGFEIPGEKNKYFYVWLDAPIGYIASTQNYCDRVGRNYKEFWNDPQAEIYHFIGKDITYFHALFWPAMLMGSGFNTPKRIQIHGFLTVNGVKMSKSRGTFINAATYLKHLDPQYLRYYFACKLGPATEDIDLNIEDFAARVNSNLVGKIANLVSRSASMLNKSLDGKLGTVGSDGQALLSRLQDASESIAEDYEQVRFSTAVRKICDLADDVNRYFDNQKPWVQIKSDPEAARETLTVALNASKLLTLYLKPILPAYAEKVERILNIAPLTWNGENECLENHTIGPFERLIERVEIEKVNQMIEESKEEQIQQEQPQGEPSEIEKEPIAEQITFDDFTKVDLRVALVAHAEAVEGANKLLRLKLDLGSETREVLAGLSKSHDPEQLIGKQVVMCANLAPRKMKFGVSEGMVLAAGPGGKDIFVLEVENGAQPGQRVH
jgi:methionyl-tRNA synthetase